MVKVRVKVPLFPTENEEKVRQAVKNILDVEITGKDKCDDHWVLVGRGEGERTLLKLHFLIRRDRIADAVRSKLLKCVIGNSIVFHANKQAAYAGHFSFSEPGESPLGTIEIKITCDDPQKLIDWLAPPSERSEVKS